MTIRRLSAALILVFIILFLLAGFFLLSFMHGEFDPTAFFLGMGMLALILIQYNVLKGVFKHLERITLLMPAS